MKTNINQTAAFTPIKKRSASSVHSYSSKITFLLSRILILLLSLLITYGAISQTVYHVKTSGDDSKDGKSWSNAFKTVQKALASAVSGDEIWIAAGTYYPDEGAGLTDNDRNLSFHLKTDVGIYGGFVGTETLLKGRNWKTNITTLSGDIDKNNALSNNSYHVVVSSGVSNTAVLDGFTITSGNGELGNTFGGGMLNWAGSAPLISNCIFSGNYALTIGGAMYNNSSSPILVNCSFSRNSSHEGAGIGNLSSSPILGNCSFSANTGSDISNYSSSPTLVNCSFSGNSGGGISNNSSSPTVTNCIFWGNIHEIHDDSNSVSAVSYSIVQGGFSGNDNLDKDPLFVDAANGNLRLQGCSPAINVGSNDANPLTIDLDSNTRIVQDIIDMGAYEYQADGVPTIVYVNTVASGNNDGTSWTNAYNKLQDALTKSVGCGGNVEVWVAKGTYYPDEGNGLTDNDRSLSFNLKNSVALYGGFAGTETMLTQRNWKTNVTILSGDLKKDDASGFSNNGDNSYHVVKSDGVNSSALIDGFTITEGNADGDNPGEYLGGGMLNGNNATPTVSNCSFVENTATEGAGIYNLNSSPSLVNCSFSGNVASVDGGGIHNSSSSPKLINCIFWRNLASRGAGIYNYFESSPMLINCSFSQNSASVDGGGGMFNSTGAGLPSPSLPTLINCILSGDVGGEIAKPADDDLSVPTVTYSIVRGGYDGNGNFDRDPLFVNTDIGNLRLQSCSPAIDTGSNAAVTLTVDLDGNTRITNATGKSTAIVDLGAYEYTGSVQALTLFCPPPLSVNGCGVNDITSKSSLAYSTSYKSITTTQLTTEGGGVFGCVNLIIYKDAIDNANSTTIKTIVNRTFTATDTRGNTQNCIQTITIEDKTKPTINNCPSDVTVYTGVGHPACSQVATWSAPAASDNCGGTPSLSSDHHSGDVFSVGTTKVTYTATDASGNTSACSFNVNVQDNTPPNITCPASQTLYLNASCSASLPDYRSMAIVSDNCTSTGDIQITQSPSPNQTVSGTGQVTITLTAQDGSGNQNFCTFTVNKVDNTKPVISNASSSVAILYPPNHKMVSITINYGLSDNCGGTINSSLSVSSNEPISGTGDGDTSPDWYLVDNHHVQLRAERSGSGDGRIYTIQITATDASGNTSTSSVTVRVTHNITTPASGAPFKIGSTVGFAGTFWDNPSNKHTANWLIDDNTTVTGAVTEPTATNNGKVTGSHKFTTAGVYKLQMNTIDQNKVMSYASTNGDLEEIVVIYDPNGGYAYGGGWFNSPAGALTSNPQLTGKVSYGFAVNYYKGATLPKGETQFQFNDGGFEFNAVNFTYLSISGYKAVFKGSGKIVGGQSGINFIMYVIDGALDGTNVDKVRIKIYNKNTGQVYYDNEPGSSDAANPKTPVGSGSTIVISGTAVVGNVNTGTQAVVTAEQQATNESLQVRALPNPTNTNFTVVVKGNNQKDEIKMFVVDMYGKMIEQRTLANEQTVTLGDRYRPGVYIVKFIQGDQSKQLKLIKLPN